MTAFYVGLGGAIGSMLRYWASIALNTAAYPWGTLAVNVVGSALIGVCAGLGVAGNAKWFLVSGVLGGFTTFSAFSLDTGLLWERDPVMAVSYVALSLVLGLGAFFLAWFVTRP